MLCQIKPLRLMILFTLVGTGAFTMPMSLKVNDMTAPLHPTLGAIFRS